MAVALPAMAALALSGCEADEYPPDLKYPGRTEPLVTAQIPTTPTRIDRPGELPLILVNLEVKDRSIVLDPSGLEAGQTQQIEGTLYGLFGTPLSPKVDATNVDGIDPKARQALHNARETLNLDEQTLARGSALYRIHCLHCHGLSGNGRGPTAPWVNPHPRDYRQGIFKFTSSDQPDKIRKPRRQDLVRTIHEGVEGTSMPSFGLLAADQIEALASYVTHLSIRGQLEFNLMKDLLSPETRDADLMTRLNGNLRAIATWWSDAEKHVIRPGPRSDLPTAEARRASVQRGFRLFRDTSAAGCIGCHKDYGRQALFFYDSWGTIGRPTNLTENIYRGGRRPIDFYWRIHSGVNGAFMPSFSTLLQPDQIWDLVSFVEALPYPAMRELYKIDIDTPSPQ
jgi:mono/diheme cytochrome c family protein